MKYVATIEFDASNSNEAVQAFAMMRETFCNQETLKETYATVGTCKPTATVLESIAHVMAKHAKFHNSEAAMIVCNLAEELRNYMTNEEVNALFDMFSIAKRY